MLRFIVASCLASAALACLQSAFSQHRVVPDVVTTAPRWTAYDIIVSLDSFVIRQLLRSLLVRCICLAWQHVHADAGKEYAQRQLDNLERRSVHAGDGWYVECFYLSLNISTFVNPDALSRYQPQFRECLHWLVINIPGDNVMCGDQIFKYFPGAPPQDYGCFSRLCSTT